MFPGDSTHTVYSEDTPDGLLTMAYRDAPSLHALFAWLHEASPKEAVLRLPLANHVDRYFAIPFPNIEEDDIEAQRAAMLAYSNPLGLSSPPSLSSSLTKTPVVGPEFCRFLLYCVPISVTERCSLALYYAEQQEFVIQGIRDHLGQVYPIPHDSPLGLMKDDTVLAVDGLLITGANWPEASPQVKASLRLPHEEGADDLVMLLRQSPGSLVQGQHVPERAWLSEWAFVQGWLLQREKELNHPLVLGPDWSPPQHEGDTKRAIWRRRVIMAGRVLDDSKEVEAEGPGDARLLSMCRALKLSVLELEEALRVKGTVMSRDDKEGKSKVLRAKWRQFVIHAQTPAQLLLALRLLAIQLDRKAYDRALNPWPDRQLWMDTLVPIKRIELAEVGDFVVYYTQGHEQAKEYDGRFKGCIWGTDPIPYDHGPIQVTEQEDLHTGGHMRMNRC